MRGLLHEYFTNGLIGSCEEIIQGENIFFLRKVAIKYKEFDIIRQESVPFLLMENNKVLAACFIWGGDTFWLDNDWVHIPFAIAVGVIQHEN